VTREVTRLRALSPASEDAANVGEAQEVARTAEAADATDAKDPRSPTGAPSLTNGVRTTEGAGPSPSRATTLTAEAGGPTQETWIRFHLTVEAGIVKSARFKAYACPHTLAVVDWLTRRLPGRTRDDGPPGTPAGWAEELSVPVEKLGRLLVVEDALLACFARWPGEAHRSRAHTS
jgi:hypothetical protein